MAVKPTKLETILKQLHRPAGVNIAQLQKVTGWQPHSIRAALTGLRRKGHVVAAIRSEAPARRRRAPRRALRNRMRPNAPGGKHGLILDRLERTAGATIDELVDATGWQKHSVHGALSRLRSAGFAVRLESTVGRKAYRLAPAEA